jgi:hypothetical protein
MSDTKETHFKVGDKCKAFGLDCRVTCVEHSVEYPVLVEFTDCREESFTQDGKHEAWHAEPSLIFVSRPKPGPKYVKRTMYAAVMQDRRSCSGEIPSVTLSSWLQRTQGNALLVKSDFHEIIGYAPIDVWVREAND